MRSSLEVLATRKFRGRFMECVGRRPLALSVVSPFIGSIPGFGTIADFARILLKEDATTFMMVTQPPDSGSGCISRVSAEALQAIGVDLRIRKAPYLHSKIYRFDFREGDRAAFVGSANFTKGGLQDNDETMAFFRHRDDISRVDAELTRLTGLGAVPFALWRSHPQLHR